MNAAILVIDDLEDFFLEGRLKERRNQLVKYTNELTELGRNKHIPIIWVRQEFKADLSDAFLAMRKSGDSVTIENTFGSKILTDLTRQDDDYEVIKKRYSAFFKTNLDELLEKLNVDTLIMCGVNTHACIRTAVIDAYQRDYEVIIATDCTDSYDEEHHNVSMKYLTRNIAQAKTNKEISDLFSL